MKRSLLIYFAWISIVLAAGVSCRSARIYTSGALAEMIRESVFTDSIKKTTFKAKVIYQERELDGIMLIKNAGDGNLKIAFFNELGITYLEGTLETSSQHKNLIVKNVAPILNNKLFLKNFEKSIQIAFSDNSNPSPHASPPPRFPVSPLPLDDNGILIVQLRNGFRLELKPQH